MGLKQAEARGINAKSPLICTPLLKGRPIASASAMPSASGPGNSILGAERLMVKQNFRALRKEIGER